jgi:tetratricopeptide (TPR) repeat protein
MQNTSISWITSTQSLIAAITALIVAIPLLLQEFLKVIDAVGNFYSRLFPPKEPPPPKAPRPNRHAIRLPGVVGLCLLTAALSLLGARVLTQQNLPLNAKLANAAWAAWANGNYEQAIQKSSKCIDEFGAQAYAQQAELAADAAPPAPTGEVPEPMKKVLLGRGLLNDVGACLFVKARAAEKVGKIDEAHSGYEKLSTLTYARVYDPAGFFWSPAEAASARLKRQQ